MTATGQPFKGMYIGDRAEICRIYSATDIEALHRLAGLPEPEDRSVPGPLVGALFSYLLGVKLPGYGTNYLKQELIFERPAMIGEALTARVEIIRLRPEKHLVDLATQCIGPDGSVICRGRALVLAQDVQG